VISPDSAVLLCYQLAHFYHVDPRIFLEQTISEVLGHMRWTEKLTEKIREEQEAQSSSDG
jgi:hypothetical protein